jgi:CrcB protein
MQLLFLACAGGAIGAGLRFLVNQAFAVRGLIAFPWPTLTVNVVGGFLMGVVYVVVNERLGSSPEWKTFLATGILGGLAMLSAYSLDMMNMLGIEGLSLRFVVYAAGSVILAFVALAAREALKRTVLS